MTYREVFEKEKPKSSIGRRIYGGMGCPEDYGYEKPWDCDLDCGACWDREMPGREGRAKRQGGE